MTRFLPILCILTLLSSAATASDRRCAHSEARDLALDLSGVKTVMFEVGSNTLRLDAVPGNAGALQGRACAVSADLLQGLTLTQRREGDKLVVTLRDDRPLRISFGSSYSYLDIGGTVPDNVLVQLKVGSGDASVTGASTVSADVGSGDAEARKTRGRVTAKVGSGDVKVDDAGALHVLSIGSGDVQAVNVRGTVEVGSIGSGDFTLKGAGGDVRIGSIGSGDADLERISGNIVVNSIGSGDLDVADVTGNLTVRSKGSGSIGHNRVSGTVDIPRRR
jgi:hypothetical protein